MLIIDNLRRFFTRNNNSNISGVFIKRYENIVSQAFLINSAINIIAGLCSKCEFRTFEDYKPIRGEEHYLWNIEPNKNQNSSEFIQEVITKLLYYNEVLIVEIGGELYAVDSFYREKHAVTEDYFTDVTKENFTFSKKFKMSDVIYLKNTLNNVPELLKDVCTKYESLQNDILDAYGMATGDKFSIKFDTIAQGDKDFEAKVKDVFENKMKKFFESKNAVLPLYNGWELKQFEKGKSGVSINDYTNISKEELEKISQAFKIPVPILKGDIADVKEVTNNLLTFCIDPILDMVSEEINRKRYGKKEVLSGNYLSVDTSQIKHIDVFDMASNIDKLIACSIYSPDEVRVKIGDYELKTPESQKHYITKNYEDIKRIEEGGE